MEKMMNKDDLYIREFTKGDENIVQQWRDSFPFKDGTEGCAVNIGNIYHDAKHLLVCLKSNNHAIGSACISAGVRDQLGSSVEIGIGDLSYCNKQTLCAIRDLLVQYMHVFHPEINYVFLFNGKQNSMLNA